jgi:hypothetical protein
VGGDSSKVRVLALESVTGSIRLITALDPGVCGDQDPLDVAQNLAQQSSDPYSALKNGRLTCTATGATVRYAIDGRSLLLLNWSISRSLLTFMHTSASLRSWFKRRCCL